MDPEIRMRLISALEGWLMRHPEPQRIVLIVLPREEVSAARMVDEIKGGSRLGEHFIDLFTIEAAECGWDGVIEEFESEFR